MADTYPEHKEGIYKMRDYWCDLENISDEGTFDITDWELKQDKGMFDKKTPDWYKTVRALLLEVFGEPDTGCTTVPQVLKVTLMDSW